MKKLVIGSILTAVLAIGVEDSSAATWKVGAKNAEAKTQSANEFGTDYKAEFSLIAEDFEAVKGYLTDLSDNTALSEDVKSKAKKAASAIKGLYEFEEGESEDLKKTKLLSTAKKAAEKGWTDFDANIRATVTFETCQNGQAQRLVILCARLLKDMASVTFLAANEETNYVRNLIAQTSALLQSLAGQLQQIGATHPRTNEALEEVNVALNKANTLLTAAPVQQQAQTYAPVAAPVQQAQTYVPAAATYTPAPAAAPVAAAPAAAAPAPAAASGRR